MRVLENVKQFSYYKFIQSNEPIETLSDYLKSNVEKVNELIINKVGSDNLRIKEIVGHILKLKSKRIRPLLTLAFCKLMNYEQENQIQIATCIEFIHTATLLHDDVIDQSAMRRGEPTAHMLWGNKAAILAGDFIFAKAFELMFEQENVEALKLLASTSVTLTEGEMMQLQKINSREVDLKLYETIIYKKTSVLFAASCGVSAKLAECNEKIFNCFMEYGKLIGIAFQLIDDALDYTQRPGKEIGNDFKEGKMTFPLIHTYTHADEKDKKIIDERFNQHNRTDDDLRKVSELIYYYSGIEYTIEEAEKYVRKAKEKLEEGVKQLILSGFNIDMNVLKYLEHLAEGIVNIKIVKEY